MPAARFDHPSGGFALSGCTEELTAWRLDEVVDVVDAAERAARSGHWVAGFVAYDAAPAFDDHLRIPQGGGAGAPLAWFGAFEERIDDPPALPPPVAAAWDLAWGPEEHAEAVRRIQSLIAEGRTYQVNLTTRARSRVEDPAALYASLIGAQRGHHSALITTSTHTVACASPELFFTADGDRIVTRPMKGTARRGRWPAEDDAIAHRLRADTKQRAENVMIVDLLRNDIGRIATLGSVTVPSLFDVERYPTVWQLTSTVQGAVPPGTTLVRMLEALFPSGSVTGAPKRSTMDIIADLEPEARGVYCGAVGLLEPGEPLNASFAVAIRTATIDHRNMTAHYGAGGGITWPSDPATEWDELEAKLLGSPGCVGGGRIDGLFETFRGDDAARVDEHLDRMAASAAYFDIPFDRKAAESQVPRQPRRVRLDLDPAGTLTVTTAPLPETTCAPVRLAVCDEPIASRAAVIFHKVTNRKAYTPRGVDDLILVNERGEVTETTIANLAVCLAGRWYTPALHCGLLPGIERARLLRAGVLEERVVTTGDLARADALAVVSSLRGWRAAELYPS